MALTAAVALPAPAPRLDHHPPIPVDVLRGPALESRHVVFGCLWGGADAGGVTASWGDAELVTYLRSALKPFQVLPLFVDGVADALGLEDEELALATGSHSGQDVHLAVLKGLMEKGGVDERMLQCGRHRPYHKDAARRVGEDYTALHNNCSGKHAAMLTWCLAEGVDPAGYLLADHPLQRRIIEMVALLTGLPAQEIPIGVDGCGVPTLAVPLSAMARMFRCLARPEETLADGRLSDDADRLVAALTRVREVMQAHPLMVGGEERPDTDMISYTDGRFVTKAGAEGLWCGVDTVSGSAFAFKAVDGHFRATVPAALEVLAARRMVTGPELAALERHHHPVLKNHAGTTVGTVVPLVP